MSRWAERVGRVLTFRSGAGVDPAPDTEPDDDDDVDVGRYQRLYKYLHNRYADRVVLTFAEIEDLLGFSLPEAAWLRQEWWWDGTDRTAPRAPQSDCWTRAGRTARVNLAAQSVLFERRPIESARRK